MPVSPSAHARGTRFTDYSSIHSTDAFVGDYQAMYTPGSTSPPVRERKVSRFRARQQNTTNSFVLPANIPNTSQILPDRGTLSNVQVKHKIPADEKQIIASLRSLQNDLNAAMETIAEITRERDEALNELRQLRAVRKVSTPAKIREPSVRVEEELFDLSRFEQSPAKSPARKLSNKKVTIGSAKPTQNHAKVLSNVPVEHLISISGDNEEHLEKRRSSSARDTRQQYKKPTVNDIEDSIVAEDPTAASNTSRRRRRTSLDENMTSAYILPDITVADQQQQEKSHQAVKPQISRAAQNVLHNHDPLHIAECEVCRRLTSHKSKQTSPKADYTAQVTALMKDIALEEPTMRPKISPHHALAHLKNLLDTQFQDAKRKHSQAWEEYDAIPAPLNSKKHAAASEAMFYWSKKMEECRVNLDQLRDVEEGMISDKEN